MPAEAPGSYFVGRLRGRDVAAVGSQFDAGPPTAVWSTYIWVEGADDTAAEVSAAGGRVLVEPFDVLDAGRMAVCADPAGAVFDLWQPGTHRGAQLVNAPGTWNWSNLATTDMDGATAFYGAVFGWEAGTVAFGEMESVMWRRPGYADFLEQYDPDLRRRHSEFGTPEGFSDAIGWMMPLDPDQAAAGVPPHWAVTFSVDDADVVAARAVERGGAVIVPPYDAGVVRIAVLRDPQGAVFTVSRFAPG
jgi:predicted enzyme related to lactoylglutathione lyase